MGGPARDFTAQVGKCKAGARRVACTRARGQGIECELEGVEDADVLMMNSMLMILVMKTMAMSKKPPYLSSLSAALLPRLSRQLA